MNSPLSKLAFCVTALAALAGCSAGHPAADANEANLTAALNTYLARRGDLCVGRSHWPVVVTREEAAQVSRNSVQLPVLEKLGLVASTEVDAKARRYDLTDKGRLYYLARAPRINDNGTPAASHDFCVARLSLHKLVGWDQNTGAETVVTYTYDIAPAPWTADPAVRRVFPVIDRMVRGAGALELKEAMVLTPAGWQAKDL